MEKYCRWQILCYDYIAIIIESFIRITDFFFSASEAANVWSFMPSFQAFAINIKISTNLTDFVWAKCHFSTNFNLKSWETGHKTFKVLYVKR